MTVFEQEHFQGKCQEFTSECCNIQECGFDNIRSVRVESGAWVPAFVYWSVHTYSMHVGVFIWLCMPMFDWMFSRSIAGWVMSTMTSRDSSSSWREESILTGILTVETCHTMWRDSCLLDLSTALWVIHPCHILQILKAYSILCWLICNMFSTSESVHNRIYWNKG